MGSINRVIRGAIVYFAYAAFGFFSAEARAENALDVELTPIGQVGHSQPSLSVRANVPLRSVKLAVTRTSDGRTFRKSFGSLRAGGSQRFLLPLGAPGEATFQGELEATTADGGGGSMPIEVSVRLLPPVELSVAPEDLDLDARTLRLRSNRPLADVRVSVLSDEGRPLGASSTAPEVGEDGLVYLTWEQSEGTVLKISVKGTDEHGFFGGLDLYPWRVDIPHEDVEFATGAAEIRKAEEPKLKASLDELRDALRRYGKLASGVKLFIAGHTDTVGDAESNRALSAQRARAIGRWFRRRGIKVPIRYAGFGESMLLVDTKDDADEPRNRRAEYIVAIDAPIFKHHQAQWKAL